MGKLYYWLKPSGFMSHQIDFKCHHTAQEWNGHRVYSELEWRLLRGRRPYLLNRQPHSAHINHMKESGCEIICDVQVKEMSGITRGHLAPRFRHISEDDLTTSGSFIQAIKMEGC